MRWLDLALRAGLLFLTALVIFLWMVRLGSDLTWDEATNFRVYARNPLTALALYHEPNNHILESFVKSLFYWGLGLDEPNVLRITGFLFVAAYVAIGWALFRRLTRGGAIVAATVLVLLMLLTRAFNYWAIEMRGYFLSILLQFAYLLVLVRQTGLLPGADQDGIVPQRREWNRKTLVGYALLSALIVLTLPTNLLATAALWVITVAAFRSATPVRMYVELGIASGLLTILFYTPAALSALLGISQFHSIHGHFAGDPLRAARDEIVSAVAQLAPRGLGAAADGFPNPTPAPAFGWAMAAFAAVAALAAFRPARRLTRFALLMIAVSLVVRTAFGICFSYPFRARCAQVPILAIGLLLAVFDLTSSWRPKVQVLLSLGLVAAALALVPTLIREEHPNRAPSEIAALVEMDARSVGARQVLVLGRDLGDPLVPVVRFAGRDRFVPTPTELDSRFRGTVQESRHAPGSWQRRLRDAILGDESLPPIDPQTVDYLVLIDSEPKRGQASTWELPALDAIKARLPRRSEYQREEYRIRIFRMP